MARTKTYRQPTMRQIEAFKAVIETGTVSRAAEVLNMSQPAASKLLTNLEADIGLTLFERRRGLLVPNERGVRFYQEIDRIFSGLNQINRAVDSLRREEQGQLVIGCLPGLSGHFICSVIAAFKARHPDVFISLQARSSQFIVEWMRAGHVDVGVITGRAEDTHIESTSILRQPLTCFLPRDHPLAARTVLTMADIADQPIISFMQGSYTRLLQDKLFESHRVQPHVVVEATTSPNVCEMVALGLGIALSHPFHAVGMADRIAIRPFAPENIVDYQLCRLRHGRNRRLVSAFVDCVHETSEGFARGIVTWPSTPSVP